ncbi:MAG: hypothetical protein Q9197_001854 [Variospora fuerteventurae]
MNAFGSITLNLVPRTGRVFPRPQGYYLHRLVSFCLVCLTRYAPGSGFTPSDERRSISSFSQVVLGHKCARGAVKTTVYREAIDLLYSSNTFDISDLGILKYFVQGVPSTKLALIRDLRVHWSKSSWLCSMPSAHADFGGTWNMFWRIAMVELKDLRTISIMMCCDEEENHMPNEASHLLKNQREFLDWDFFWNPHAQTRCRLVQGKKRQ